MAKQKISKDEVASTKERMSTTTNMEDIADVDYVIEAVPVSSPLMIRWSG